MRKSSLMYVSLIALAFFVLLLSCNKDDGPTGGDNGNSGDNGNGDTEVYKYIKFRIECDDPSYFFNVGLFDESSRVRLIYGNSLPVMGDTLHDKTFCSWAMKLPISGSYRIEFYKPGSGEDCVMWFKNITYQDDPSWWVDDCSEPADATIYIGGCRGLDTISDCWGG